MEITFPRKGSRISASVIKEATIATNTHTNNLFFFNGRRWGNYTVDRQKSV